jgi:hypothetical protein
MSSQTVGETISHSASNAGVKNAANKIFLAWRRKIGKPDDVTFNEIEGDNLKGYMHQACMWAVSATVPFGGVNCFDDQLEPTNPNNKRRLTHDTLGLYLGQHLQAIKAAFPDHQDFKRSIDDAVGQVTPWWSEMRKSFLKKCERFQNAYSDDFVFGLEPVQPLYKNNDAAIGQTILGKPVALCACYPDGCQGGGIVVASRTNGYVTAHPCTVCAYWTHGGICCGELEVIVCYYCAKEKQHPSIP